MYVNIQALGGQWDSGKLGALIIALRGSGLGLLLSLYGVLGYSRHCLLSAVAGRNPEGEHKPNCRKSPLLCAHYHAIKDSRNDTGRRNWVDRWRVIGPTSQHSDQMK
jgi:hypothetical protein